MILSCANERTRVFDLAALQDILAEEWPLGLEVFEPPVESRWIDAEQTRRLLAVSVRLNEHPADVLELERSHGGPKIGRGPRAIQLARELRRRYCQIELVTDRMVQ